VKELDRLGDVVLNEHPLGIACDERCLTELEVVGHDHGGFLMPQIDHGQLPEQAIVTLERDVLVQHPRGAEGPGQRVQGDPLPGGSRAAVDFSQHLARASAQGDKEDALLVELGQVLMRGELGIED